MHNMHVFLTEIKWERLKVIQDPTDSDPLLLFYRETPHCKSMLNYRSRSAFNLKICLFYHVYFYISNIIMRRISLLTNTLRIAFTMQWHLRVNFEFRFKYIFIFLEIQNFRQQHYKWMMYTFFNFSIMFCLRRVKFCLKRD